ncbi:hypothetical protein AB3S75_024942 [Citrus x aurantiifolia]
MNSRHLMNAHEYGRCIRYIAIDSIHENLRGWHTPLCGLSAALGKTYFFHFQKSRTSPRGCHTLLPQTQS